MAGQKLEIRGLGQSLNKQGSAKAENTSGDHILNHHMVQPPEFLPSHVYSAFGPNHVFSTFVQPGVPNQRAAGVFSPAKKATSPLQRDRSSNAGELRVVFQARY
jgi:hypothetical protein